MSWEYMIIHDLIGVDGFNLTLMARRPEMVRAVTALFHLCVPRLHPSSFQQFSQRIAPVDGYGSPGKLQQHQRIQKQTRKVIVIYDSWL